MRHQLASWINRINLQAAAGIRYADDWFLAGVGESSGDLSEQWFISQTSTHEGVQIHVQAHGHPRGLAVLSTLAGSFAAFDQQFVKITTTLRSINTEYLCVFYNSNEHTVYVVSDKIGIVPAYIYRHNGNIYYATALWILKLLDQFTEDLDWQGVAEKLYFRSPIGDRTLYKGVTRLLGGTIARIDETIKKTSYYNLWDNYRTVAPDRVPTLLAEGIDAAVVDRLTANPIQYSTLSGGLDSRVVLTSLSKHTKKIVTFNFAGNETLDARLSEMYARHVGAEHHHEPSFALYYPNFSMLSRNFLNRLLGERSDESQIVWTGDDGSISIGFVYLRRHLLDQINSLDSAQLPEFICNAARVLPQRMFKKTCYEDLRRLACEGVRQFLVKLGEVDHAAKYYSFLMLNRVPRMFDEHYETAHLHRILRCMPFLDVRAIEPVLSADMPEGSEHRLYLDFARRVSERVLEVPWQAYPGHEPCHLPLPDGKNQWQAYYDEAETKFLRKAHRRKMIRVMTSKFWQTAVRREMLAAYVVRDWLGIEPTGGVANALCDVLDEHMFRGAISD